MSHLTGRTALVTGASRGIGRAIAIRLAADKARVAVHYGSNEAAAKHTVATIQQAGGEAFAMRADLAADEGVHTLFDQLTDRLGSDGLDILVNNAGIGVSGPIEATDPAQFDRLFAVNVRAPFFIVRRALPLLTDGGRIINIGSGTTRIAVPIELAYTMSKGALESMAAPLANGLGRRGITVNTVAPGMTNTDILAPGLAAHPEFADEIRSWTSLDRIGEPAEVAAVVSFLAGPDGGWVTGQRLEASGGIWLGPRIPA